MTQAIPCFFGDFTSLQNIFSLKPHKYSGANHPPPERGSFAKQMGRGQKSIIPNPILNDEFKMGFGISPIEVVAQIKDYVVIQICSRACISIYSFKNTFLNCKNKKNIKNDSNSTSKLPKLTKKDITIIIVAYKSTHIILEALKNIVGRGYPIKIVDNGSGDNLEELLKQNHPNSGIELILLANNCGFGRANNVALEQTTTKYAFLLNPDAIITEQSLDNLEIEADKDQNIALASPFPAIKENQNKEEQQQAIDTYKTQIKIFAEDENIIQTNFICGGYMLMNMAAFRKIGFFDKNLFLYGEDGEISGRSLDNGYKNILVKNSQAFHHIGKSIKINNKLTEYKILYLRNYHRAWSTAYLKRSKNNIHTIVSAILYQFLSSLACLLVFHNKFIPKLAKSFGSASNLLGINCFNKKNKIVKIQSVIKI